ncbi:DUF4384 domain-containing protein [Candidatus Poribacteria bacterium]|nr:DUF4384 domain-containing protein [Candidatus Poribacteria bacterium]
MGRLLLILLMASLATSAAASWRAVLVGVDDYRAAEIADLRCAESDARLMRDTLARLGVARDGMSLLLGADAPRDAIRRAVIHRASEAASDDRVLIYFSGHGGTTVAAGGETALAIYPWDGRPADSRSAISLADLASWVADVGEALIVLDCGFVLPSEPALYSPHRVKSLGGPPAVLRRASRPANVTLIVSEPGPHGTLESATLRQGVLTHHIARALSGTADVNRDGWVTPYELVTHAAGKMRENAYAQEASLVGDRGMARALPTVPMQARPAPGGRPPVAGPPELMLRVEQTSSDPRVARLTRALQAALAAEPHVRLARGGQPPDGVLILGGANATTVSVDLLVRYVNPNAGAESNALRYSRATDDTVAAAADAIAARLAGTIAEASARKAIAILDNPHSPLRLGLEAPRRLRIGDTLTLTLTPTSDCYLILLNLSTDGSLNVLYPNGFVEGNHVRAGDTVTIPGPDWKMRAYGPAGIEIVKAIATTSPVDLGGIDLTALMAKDVYSVAAGDSPETLRRLAESLMADFPTHEWAIDVATIVVGDIPTGRKDPLELNALE